MTPRSNHSPLFTQHVASSRALRDSPFVLLDVGASGGIESHWQVFGDDLEAVGFEPLVAECERLNQAAPPRVRYEACFVGAAADLEAQIAAYERPIADPFGRSSALRASAQKQLDYVQEHFNRGDAVVYTERRTTLDDYCAEHGIATVDFVKIDTDGHDYQVIHGAGRMLAEQQVLGLFVECQLHGALGEHSNTLRNIDRVLCELGFSIFDIELYRYTRRDLPGKFCYRIDAQTTTGQVLWGDALFLRDMASPGYAERFAVPVSPAKIVKLACIQEMYGMPDCAAELLRSHRQAAAEIIDVDASLDLLARDVGIEASFAAHDRRFREDLPSFYP